AFLVEGLGTELGLTPITRCDAGAANSHLVAVVGWDELQLGAAHRKANISSSTHSLSRSKCGWPSLRRPKSAQDQDTFSTRAQRHLIKGLPEVLRHTGSGVPQQLDVTEKTLRERLVLLEVGQEDTKASRHVEVPVRRNITQVANRQLNAARGWFTPVHVKRSPVIEGEIEIVIAAGSVIPRRPIE